MLVVGVISVIIFIVSLVLFFVNYFRRKNVKVLLLIMLVSLVMIFVGIGIGAKDEVNNKASDNKKEVSKKEVKDDKMSEDQWKEYQKEFKELVKMSIDANDSISVLVSSYSVKKYSTSIAVDVKVSQDIKYVSKEQKQKAADGLGQVFYGAASGALATTLGTPDAMSLDIKMHYSDDDVLFTENRMIVNPKEFKVKN